MTFVLAGKGLPPKLRRKGSPASEFLGLGFGLLGIGGEKDEFLLAVEAMSGKIVRNSKFVNKSEIFGLLKETMIQEIGRIKKALKMERI